VLSSASLATKDATLSHKIAIPSCWEPGNNITVSQYKDCLKRSESIGFDFDLIELKLVDANNS
jgi:hypothetical protein